MRPPTAYRVLLLLLLCALADTVVDRGPRALRACDKSNIIGIAADRYDFINNELKCKPKEATNKEAIIFNDTDRYESITCDPNSGWMSGSTKIAAATEEMKIKCETFDLCAVQQIKGAVVDSQTKILTCTDTAINNKNKFLKLIEVGTVRYASLKCDETTGWTDGTTPVPDTASNKILKMTCQEYCAHFGDGVKMDVDSTGLKREIACQADFHRLFFGNDEVEGNGATCSEVEGWKSKDWKVGGWTASNMQTLKVECREVCRADTQNGTIIEDETDKAKKSYKCELPDRGATKYGVELNGEYVYSRVKCSMETGWTDESGNKLGEAFDAVALKCAPVTCVHTSTCENVPVGSDCVSVKATEMDTLKCDSMYELYETKLGEYYTSELRCRTIGDDRWLTFEDTNVKGKITIRGRALSVVCLRRRCNKCEKLADVTVAEFTPGKAGTCAKNSCTLWKLRTEGSSAQQQYAGGVSCSSDKETEGKWLTDENVIVEVAACINKDKRESVVKCTEASPIVTNCNANLTAFGCAHMNPLDTGNVECADKKEMFFKPPGSPFFLKGTKITCHKATGLWKVERQAERPHQLKRGGVIICADRNPAPPPSMPMPQAKEGDRKTIRLALMLCCSVAVVLFLAAIATVIYSQVRKCRRGNAY